MSFLGIIAVCLIIWAGFLWMTARGNEDKVKEAQTIIKTSIIGLVIILAAWAITDWVLATIQEVNCF
jgi:hypothetical protein